MEKVNNCDRCGLPAWKSHGGMGGSIMPDVETHCLKRDGMNCRSRRIAYLNGIQKGVSVAKEKLVQEHRHDDSYCPCDWTGVDAALADLLS